MTYLRITDHAERGVARLIERYRQPKISALLASWLGEVQQLEDALYLQLTEGLTRQLDVLGRIVGQPRDGRTDEVFLAWIRARIQVNRSSGKTTQLIAVAKAVGVTDVRLEEQYPAAVVVHGEAAFDWAMGNQIAKLLYAAKAAGVRLYFEWFNTATPFRFASGSSPETASPNGFNAGLLAAVSDGLSDVTFAGGGG